MTVEPLLRATGASTVAPPAPAHDGTGRLPRAPLAVAAVALLLAGFLALNGERLLGTVPFFLPSFLSAVALLDLLTGVLLVDQFLRSGRLRLLVLGCAYLWSLATIVPHALVFPGLFSPTGLLDPVASSAVWLWVSWHVGLPGLIALAAAPWPAALDRRAQAWDERRRRWAAGSAIVAVVAVAWGVAALVTTFGQHVPVVIVDGDYTRLTQHFGAVITTWLLTCAAVSIWGLWWRRLLGSLGAWAATAALACSGDVVVTLVARQRFSVGWYGARVLAATAAVVVLLALLRQLQRTQRQVDRYATETAAANRVLAEQAAQLGDEKAAREQILAVVSHEMANPLTSLSGFLELAEEVADSDPDRAREMLARCRVLTSSLLRMGSDIMTFTARENGTLSVVTGPVDLAVELRWMAEQHPGASIEVSCPEDAVAVADRSRLQQVLGNLVRNAVKYGAPPIQVVVTSSRSTDRSSDSAPAGPWLLRVSDAGAPIPEHDVPILFEPYRRAAGTAHKPGIGLGLAVSRELALQMGGDLVYDAPAHAFELRLPRAPTS